MTYGWLLTYGGLADGMEERTEVAGSEDLEQTGSGRRRRGGAEGVDQ